MDIVELTHDELEEVNGAFLHGAALGAAAVGSIGRAVLAGNGAALGGATQQIVDASIETKEE